MHIQILGLVPFLSWIRRCRNRDFRADVITGLTVAVLWVRTPDAGDKTVEEAMHWLDHTRKGLNVCRKLGRLQQREREDRLQEILAVAETASVVVMGAASVTTSTVGRWEAFPFRSWPEPNRASSWSSSPPKPTRISSRSRLPAESAGDEYHPLTVALAMCRLPSPFLFG